MSASEKPLWQPSSEKARASQMNAFREVVQVHHQIKLADSTALHQWSIQERENFWEELWDFCEVKGQRKGQTLNAGASMQRDTWFAECKLNFAENLLTRRDLASAIIAYDENGTRSALSFAELQRHVAFAQARLRDLGVQKGDRIAAIIPNIAEAVVYMLATASLGAIWSSCSPDFGAAGILDRFGQIEPKVLISVDGYYYGGKTFTLLDKLREVLAALPSVTHTILIDRLGHGLEFRSLGNISLHRAPEKGGKDPALSFESVSFSHPLYILYSSGTTGKPKCIVHGAGGTLLQHLKEHRLHCDLRPGEKMLYFTTCGWMMWNWLVSALASGVTLVLFDGSPFHPTPRTLLDIVEREQIEVFGTSAKYIDSLFKAGEQPRKTHSLDSLRAILSTGSPLSPEGFDYVYREIKNDVQLASISGGTDIVSCFVLGDPTRSVYRGEIQGKGLGMDVQIWNERGEPVIGEAGELVCRKSFPSMPVGFWNDPEQKAYAAAYFEHFPGIWRHGDWAMETARGGFVIYGRSDATLNPGGVRIGTAEIYRQVERFDEVLESIVVAQPWQNDERVILFVVLREGLTLDEALQEKIRKAIRTSASPRHVPAKILQVPAVPKTRSGKISELAVKHTLTNQPIKNADALANPESLAAFKDRLELQD